jgi:hypothetical protein
MGILRNPESNKIRTREKSQPDLEKSPDSSLSKLGLEIERNWIRNKDLCTRMERFFAKE